MAQPNRPLSSDRLSARARLIGAGGGGSSSSSSPTEEKDNLNSTQFTTVVDLLSEGEIQGLKNGSQSVYLDDTVLQNPDGSYNFENITLDYVYGTQNQAALPSTEDIGDEKPVNVEVKNGVDIVRTITSTITDAVRVTITFPQLQKIQDDGDIKGTSVRLMIDVQYNGGGYTTQIDDTVSGRTADQFQRDYIINLDSNGAFPVEIKVRRITEDSTSTKKINAFLWTSYTEITYVKLRYPNSAIARLKCDAEQFSSIPSRSYLIRGIKVRIPSNATVDQDNGRLIYSGAWNGTFGAAQWCSDPAWILWDLLTSTRYGFGDHIKDAQLDKWAFYAASAYCSALVLDGYGGYEPRFSCNVNIQTQEDAYKLINNMCSVFRAMPYWSTGTLTVSQDRPTDTSYLFTAANVSEEGFTYQGGSLKTRPNVAVVSWFNLDTRQTEYEVVENTAAVKKYGSITTQIEAFACTSRGQAHRVGEWLLYTEEYESETVNFTASIDAGVVVRPGQIIEISDPVKAGSRRGGRIMAATITTVTLDDATGLTAAGGSLSVIMPDGTVQTKNIASIASSVCTLTSPFTTAPNANSIWVYQSSNVQTSTWRVISVVEEESAQYVVSAVAYNASKYNYIERDLPLTDRDITDLNVIPPPPTNLAAKELLFEDNGKARSKVQISWVPPTGINQFRVGWREQDGNWTWDVVNRLDYEILDSTNVTYEIQVYSVNSALRQSTLPAALTFQAFGKTAPPGNVSILSLVSIDDASAILSWERSTELDVLLGGKVLIRHNVATVGALWEESQEIVAAASGSQTQKQVPLLEGTYLLKFEDDTGNRSVTASTAVVDLPTPQPRLLIKTYAEDQGTPPFSGNVTDMFYSDQLDGLIIASGIYVDDMAPDVVPGSPLIDEAGDPILDENGNPILAEADPGDWDSLASIDSVGGVDPVGEYEFGSTWDMGGVFDVNMRRRFVTRPYLPAALWDDKVGLIDDWPEIDETNLDAVNATLYVRSTLTNPSASPTWSDWNEFSNAIVRGRGFQFKMIATSSDPNQNIVIEELGAELELQQRVEQSGTLTTAAATYSAAFASNFYAAPAIGLTAYNMGTGDYFQITNVTRTGFDVVFRNAGGTAVSRNFTYTAVGFGKEI